MARTLIHRGRDGNAQFQKSYVPSTLQVVWNHTSRSYFHSYDMDVIWMSYGCYMDAIWMLYGFRCYIWIYLDVIWMSFV